tara:strand:+ start:254 stop:901 length:648 start_codon:yes stop_codon:yes gene_type:complete
MELKQLPNDGYIRGSLPKNLFDSLLGEALECNNNQEIETGLKRPEGNETCSHFTVSNKNTGYLKDFIFPYIGKYMDNFSYINAIECLSSNSPFVFGKPWFNLQKPNDYLPIHTHNGVLSYSIWLKLPKISEFIFYYNGVVREFDHTMVLTPSDVGDFLFFPSRLRHAVHPFLSNNPNEIRISLSGNIYLQGVDDYIKGNNSYVRNTIEWNRLELL